MRLKPQVQIIHMSKETKGSKIPKVNPDSPTKSVCIKQQSVFKNTESYKKVFYLLTSLNHCKISAGIMTRNQEFFHVQQNVLLHFYN